MRPDWRKTGFCTQDVRSTHGFVCANLHSRIELPKARL